MTRRFGLFLDPVILQLVPSYRGLVVYVEGVENFASDGWSVALLRAAERHIAALPNPPALHPHMQAWASVYRGFGARPKLYKNGCLALASRGHVPPINGLVDLYNAVAMTHMLPIGGEDWDCLDSHLLRTTALGHEEFVGNDANDTPEHPYPGEPIWLDRAGVTTRRFNWRQARRTCITLATRAAYFVLDAVAPYSHDQLDSAAEALQRLIGERWPDARTRVGPLRSSDDGVAIVTATRAALFSAPREWPLAGVIPDLHLESDAIDAARQPQRRLQHR